ncbi:hypothetical protein ACC733_37520, partial [Rhizobium johnstonii]
DCRRRHPFNDCSLGNIERASSSELDKENCRGFFHKGRDYLREIDKARGRWEFDLLEHKSAVEQESVIMEI